MPAKEGTCSDCAVAHDPDMPHNQQSLHWQYRFYGAFGRWPTWADALAHCTPTMRAQWRIELARHKVSFPTNGTVLPEAK